MQESLRTFSMPISTSTPKPVEILWLLWLSPHWCVLPFLGIIYSLQLSKVVTHRVLSILRKPFLMILMLFNRIPAKFDRPKSSREIWYFHNSLSILLFLSGGSWVSKLT